MLLVGFILLVMWLDSEAGSLGHVRIHYLF